MNALFKLGLLAAAVVAAPTAEEAQAKKSFTIHQSANPGFKANGQAALLKALNKFGAHERATAVSEAAATSSGAVTATPADAYDSEYLCPVVIGTTTTKTFQLDFDTGSSDLWVFSSGLPSSERGSHNLYALDSTKRISGATWQISYGDGSGAQGTVYRDTVRIGSATVTSQAVEAATSISSEFVSDTSDGLVGLAFSTINTVTPTQQKTFFDNAITQGLSSKLFAANLRYHAAGTYDFGFLDTSKYSGSIAYTNVDSSQGFWMFTPTSYSIGTGAAKTGSLAGIADTGTTLLLAPAAVVTAYYAQVSGAQNSNTYGGYVFPCSATLPTFSLTIAGYKATVPGKYINYAPVTDGSSTCYGGIQSDAGIGFAIYGDIFLKSQYVVFDKSTSTPRLGFAAQK
ncbi:MAG: Type I transmembrane sorting receptor [Stictis urceolatum]|nr:Type I transmembrane sorting receptor [Stictis urceolata]